MTGGPCVHCGRAFDPASFPLGRPRHDGRRYPMRFCDVCLALPARHGGGIEGHRLTHRLSARRRRIALMEGV